MIRIVGDQTDVRSRPNEFVQFGGDDPTSLCVEPQMAFNRSRDFDALSRLRLPMRHRRHQHLLAISDGFDGDYDDNWAIL